MANTFGSATEQFELVDPRGVRAERARFRRDLFPELLRANSYYSMSGRWPDVGWLLLDRRSYDQLDRYSNSLRLVLADFVNEPLTIDDLSITQARCVTRGRASDPDAIYLVQVTNNAGMLYNPWFQHPLSKQYNVRVPAYDGSYYAASLNSGAAWTWSGMVGDIWASAGGLLGSYPGLPSVPDGAPDGYVFLGVPLWGALTGVLEHLGMSVSGSIPNATITVQGAADAAFEALTTRHAGALEDDLEYIDTGSARVPGSVTVYFHKRHAVYGTEETVRYDSPGWQNSPVYSVSVAAPATFSSSTGVGHLWAESAVRVDMDGNVLAADVTRAAALAADRAAQYYRNIYRGTVGTMRRVYAGALPFTTGSLVDGVRWYNTGVGADPWCGWRTEVIRGYIWPEATFSPTLKGLSGEA